MYILSFIVWLPFLLLEHEHHEETVTDHVNIKDNGADHTPLSFTFAKDLTFSAIMCNAVRVAFILLTCGDCSYWILCILLS